MTQTIDGKAERLRIASIAERAIDDLERTALERWTQADPEPEPAGRGAVRYLGAMADRLRGCGLHRFALLRGGVRSQAVTGRSMVVGCKVRVCPECAAARRGKFDRRYRPQLAGMLEAGHAAQFLTFTRRAVPGQDVGEALQAIREAWGAMRYGRQARQWWRDRVAGGLYGLEVTLYRRNRDGSIACDDNGEPDRRVHAHMHAVIVQQIGAKPADADAVTPEARAAWGRKVEAAAAKGETLPTWEALGESTRQALLVSEDLINAWIDLGRARGWTVERSAQDATPIAVADLSNDNRNAAAYLVKYIGKPGDLVTREDLLDVSVGTRGLRQVQTFGAMHGAALRKVCQGATSATLEAEAEQAEQAAQDEAESATFLAELEQSAALHHAAEVDDTTEAQGHRWQAIDHRWRQSVASAHAWAVRANAWAGRLAAAAEATQAQALADRLAKAERARERADLAERRAGNAAALAERTTDPTLAAVRQGRADRARDRAEKAQDRADHWWRQAARPVPGADVPARASVLAARADRDAERAKWRVIVRDEVTTGAHDRARDEQAHAAEWFAGMGFTLREADEAVQAADRVADACAQRFARAEADLQEIRDVIGDVWAPVAHGTLAAAAFELAEAQADANRARSAARDLHRRIPITWAVLEKARAACAAAERLAAVVESGDQQRDQAVKDRKGAAGASASKSQLALKV